MSMPSNSGVLSTLWSILTFTNIQMKVKSSFRNHDKCHRITEHFLTIILNELLAVREPEWRFQSLAVHPPTWQALRKPKSWELGTSVLFDLRSSTSLPCWSEGSIRYHVNLLSRFLGIIAALVCIATYARGLQAPNNTHRNVVCNSCPALSLLLLPSPCVCPKIWIWKPAVPWAGCWELSAGAGRKTCRFLLGRYNSHGTVPES